MNKFRHSATADDWLSRITECCQSTPPFVGSLQFMGALICDLSRCQMKIYSQRGNIFQSAGVTFEARKTETRRQIDS
jgi:hypothetical protein